MKARIVMKTEFPPESIDNVTIVKGYSYVDVRPVDIQEIARQLDGINYEILLVVEECGGGMTNTGRAQCVALPDGKPPKPFRTSHYSNSTHAEFVLPHAVTCYIYRHHSEYSITLEELNVEGDEIARKTLWKVDDINYSPDIIPQRFAQYADLIDATARKSRCYHCRDPHFIAD